MNAMNRRAFARIAMAVPAASWLKPAMSQAIAGVGKLLVGYPAGGTLDTTARQLAEAWRKQGRQYIVDNRAGAAGRIANSQLKRERPDGTALLCTHASALTIYPHVYQRLMYDPAADLLPVSPLVAATCAFAVSNAAPPSVRDVQTYVEWVRRTPGSATFASPAAGSFAHFLGYQLSEAAGLKLQHIGYRGSAPAMQDLIGGQIPAYLGFVADFLPSCSKAGSGFSASPERSSHPSCRRFRRSSSRTSRRSEASRTTGSSRLPARLMAPFRRSTRPSSPQARTLRSARPSSRSAWRR